MRYRKVAPENSANINDEATEIAPVETLPCDAVVLAIGAWTDRIEKWFPVAHALPAALRDTVGARYTSVVYPGLVLSNPPTMYFLDDSKSEVEVYPRADELYACGAPERGATLPEFASLIVAKEAEVASVRADTERLVKTATSDYATTAASCFLPSSADGGIALGRLLPGVENCFVGCGHTCWGILNGPATGWLLSGMVLERLGGECRETDVVPAWAMEFDPGRDVRGCGQQ